MDKFTANLNEASRAELAMVKLLEKRGNEAWLNPHKNGDCDIYVVSNGRQYKVEVKTDFASLHSDNICLEPQTLEHTKADWFAFIIPEVKFMPTMDVRNLYFQYYQSGKRGGDQNQKLALIPKDIFSIDFENLLVKVVGKGNKERIVPISYELRKVLYRFQQRHSSSLVFCTKQGGRLGYHNTLRDFKNLCKALGVSGVRCSFHTLRHTYALNHLREGGNVFVLQRLLGHSSVVVTQRYVNLETSDLQVSHRKTSILNRLK